MSEYEIEYTLRQYTDGSEEPEEIGFGASGRSARPPGHTGPCWPIPLLEDADPRAPEETE